MKLLADLARGRSAVGSTLLLWLVFMACAAAAALMIAALRLAEAGPWPWNAARATPLRSAIGQEFAPTFAEAAESLRRGRHAEAYGRFVALADEGDIDAARIALLMHRFGPSVFGSAWDASTEQLALWTRWSELAAEKDLSHLPPTAPRCGDVATGHPPSAARVGSN